MENRILEEKEVKDLLSRYGIRVPKGIVVKNLPDKIDIDFPVVLKVSDPGILHKSDVGGVILNIKDFDELNEKFSIMKKKFPESKFLIESMEKPGIEVIVGVIKDKTFGESIMFGLGGIFTELYRDVSFRLIPIDEYDAREMINEIKARKIFDGFRNIKVDKESVIDLLLKVSRLVMDMGGKVDQLDLNPVIVRDDGSVVVEAKMVVIP
jgi:acyl-CoA synthetase (NDP forming)